MANNFGPPVKEGLKEYCTPIVINAGYVLDPVGVLQSAKNLSREAKRNVTVIIDGVREYDHGSVGPKYELYYYIQPDPSYAFAEIKLVEVRSI